MIEESKLTLVQNAIAVGLDADAAYLYARLTPDEINDIREDDTFQRELQAVHHEHEFELLNNIAAVIPKQKARGDTHAAQWLLEKLYPKYSQKAMPDTGNVTLVFSGADTSDICTIVGDTNNDE